MSSENSQTVRFHRVLRAKLERVYRAFVDPDAMAKWMPPHGFTGKVHHMEAKIGGTYRMSFTNFSTGKSHAFGGKFLEMEPGKRLRYDDQFEDPNLPGTMITTVELREVFCGTEIHITQERSEEHTSELQSQSNLVCRLLLEKKKHNNLNKHG